ncbi:ceramide synthase membrane component (LAG1), putative [Cordyceps militaris CM01]|uniref:Ceramide synthase membrane component (LAG1), putative n=1 Tax=Cordyceps militaris (strain CM01) TaxID=983644 RepID=G3J7E1_CORMM|nr:ceramide synthase membrane component (LAG1), putative [Cordyceps militaris CM01]EGX96311.1 ceramide synthase membrane component (LAG1), putative [Cordyceps militaris CM01]
MATIDAANDKEPFPLLNTSLDPFAMDEDSAPRRRRKSSGLGGEIRAGDTGAPAFASSQASLNAGDSFTRHADSPSSPVTPTSTASPAAGKRISKRRRARGLVSRVRQLMVRRTFVLPAVLLLLFLAGYAVNPTESNVLHHFIFLSYPLPQDDPGKPVMYGKGPWDMAFVAFYIIVLTFTREFIMQELLRPWARSTGLSKAKQARFMEQAYTAVYFAFLGPAGLYVMSRTPVWYYNTTGMYADFPHRTHEAVVKFYYLLEAAYWAQQAIVLILGLEKPRKDYYELVGHHVVSLALIGLSYRFHFTYIGIAVYTSHDISDFFLATSKVLNYLDHFLIGPYFFVFVCVWVYLRHYINLQIIVSMFTEFRTVGPFELNWETQQYKCWISQYITTALLTSLQALNLFWLFYILRIAYRFVRDSNATDDRSDDEDEDTTLAEDRKLSVPILTINGEKPNGKSE